MAVQESKNDAGKSEYIHPLEKTSVWRLVAMAAVIIGVVVGFQQIYQFWFGASASPAGHVDTERSATGSEATSLRTPGSSDNAKEDPVATWEKHKAEREAKEKAEKERDAVARPRVSQYWRTVTKGDTLQKVYAILGDPRDKPRTDARTGRAIDGFLVYGGEGGLAVNVWYENEKVKYVTSGIFREVEKKPELVAKNWRDVEVGDSTEVVLRRLGGPNLPVCYDVDTDEIADELWTFEGTGGLTITCYLKSGKVTNISAEQQ